MRRPLPAQPAALCSLAHTQSLAGEGQAPRTGRQATKAFGSSAPGRQRSASRLSACCSAARSVPPRMSFMASITILPCTRRTDAALAFAGDPNALAISRAACCEAAAKTRSSPP